MDTNASKGTATGTKKSTIGHRRRGNPRDRATAWARRDEVHGRNPRRGGGDEEPEEPASDRSRPWQAFRGGGRVESVPGTSQHAVADGPDGQPNNHPGSPGASASFFADSPGYSLSLHVQDLKDHYEVRAYLPDAKSSDVNVSLLDKQTLKVEVGNKSTTNLEAEGR